MDALLVDMDPFCMHVLIDGAEATRPLISHDC